MPGLGTSGQTPGLCTHSRDLARADVNARQGFQKKARPELLAGLGSLADELPGHVHAIKDGTACVFTRKEVHHATV
jgi:hypothetical protein